MSDLDMASLVLLQQHGLPGTRAKALAALLASAWHRTAAEDAVLCREGEAGSELWVLLSGSVRVTKKDFLGMPQDLANIPAPAVLGLVALAEKGRRSAGLVATQNCEYVTIDKKRYDALMKGTDEESQLFRTLLVAALSRQLSRGRASLRSVIREAAGVDAREASLSTGNPGVEPWRQ